MIGVAINAAGIVAGGLLGTARRKNLSPANEQFLKLAMGLATIAIGLHLTWTNISGTFGSVMKQVLIVLVSMSLGKLLGRLLRLQKLSNSVGQFANNRLTHAANSPQRVNDGFMVATALACASPLAVFAAVHEGLTGFSAAFVVKALMDGLAAMSFVAIFGWGVVASALPVFAYQWMIVLFLKGAEPFLKQHDLVHSILAVDGMLIFSVSLIIFNLKKIELTDYIPSLAIAPLLTWLMR